MSPLAHQPPPEATYLKVKGSHKVERTPELADVTLRVYTEGTNKEKVLSAFKASASEIVGMITPLAPEKADVEAGSAVDAEWPVKDPTKPVVRWRTGRLSTYSWARTSRTRESTAQQYFTITFHDFAALEEFVNDVTEEKHTELIDVTWRLSEQTTKTLQAEVSAAAILDAKQRALNLLAPLYDSSPRLKAMDIAEEEYGFSFTASYRRGSLGKGGAPRSSNEPQISFEPEVIKQKVNVTVTWMVLE